MIDIAIKVGDIGIAITLVVPKAMVALIAPPAMLPAPGINFSIFLVAAHQGALQKPCPPQKRV